MNTAFAKAIAATKIVIIIDTTIDVLKTKNISSLTAELQLPPNTGITQKVSHKKCHTKSVMKSIKKMYLCSMIFIKYAVWI